MEMVIAISPGQYRCKFLQSAKPCPKHTWTFRTGWVSACIPLQEVAQVLPLGQTKNGERLLRWWRHLGRRGPKTNRPDVGWVYFSGPLKLGFLPKPSLETAPIFVHFELVFPFGEAFTKGASPKKWRRPLHLLFLSKNSRSDAG